MYVYLDSIPVDTSCGELETTGTWAAKIPSSMLPTIPPSHSPPVLHSVATSPGKRPLPPDNESPSKVIMLEWLGG